MEPQINEAMVRFLNIDADVKIPGMAEERPVEKEIPPTEEVAKTPVKAQEEEPPPPELHADEENEDTTEEKKENQWQRLKRQKKELKEELAAERAHREQLERQAAADRERLARIEGYLTQRAQPSPPEAPQATIPPFEEDPLQHLAVRQSETEKIVQEFYQREQQRLAQEQQVQAWTQFNDGVVHDVQQYATQHPDYPAAEQWLIESAWKEGRAAGLTEQQIQQRIALYTVQFAKAAWSQNRSIGEIVQQVALSRGYVPQQRMSEVSPHAKVAQAKEREQHVQATLATVPRTPGQNTPVLTPQQFAALTDEDMNRLDREQPGWETAYLSSRRA